MSACAIGVAAKGIYCRKHHYLPWMAERGSVAGRKARIEEILGDMQVKLHEIEGLRKQLLREQPLSAQKTLQMLEEIQVPSLEVIRDEKKKAAKTMA